MASFGFTESARIAETDLKNEGNELLEALRKAKAAHGPNSEEAKKAAAALSKNHGEHQAAIKLFKTLGIQ